MDIAFGLNKMTSDFNSDKRHTTALEVYVIVLQVVTNPLLQSSSNLLGFLLRVHTEPSARAS